MNATPPFACRLDHLVITARSCTEGVGWFEARSGVKMPEGGAHPLMSTHNHLTALSENQFLEVIAVDPDAPAPAHNRWFSLDDADLNQQLAISPRLTTWVVATNDLDGALAKARDAGIDPGKPVALTRGNLQWQLALREDGSLPCNGVFPVLIQWPDDVNPVVQMQDQGVRLEKLSLTHPESERLAHAFEFLGISSLVSITPGPAALHSDLRVGSHSFDLN